MESRRRFHREGRAVFDDRLRLATARGREHARDGLDVADGRGFVERQTDSGAGIQKIDAGRFGGSANRLDVRPFDAQRIEVGGVRLPVAERRDEILYDAGQVVDSLCDRTQPLGAVEHGVHGGDVGQQRLCGSTEIPMMRPGAWRTNVSRVARNAACGPP